jgi:hypothetical protein
VGVGGGGHKKCRCNLKELSRGSTGGFLILECCPLIDDGLSLLFGCEGGELGEPLQGGRVEGVQVHPVGECNVGRFH